MNVTLAMMLTMAVGSSSILAVAVSAPDAAPDIGIDATYVGLFTGLVYFISMFTGSFCIGFIVRYGPIRVLQATAVLATSGLLIFSIATPLTAIICAVLLGLAYGPINPANAPVLLKVTNPNNRAFMFSIKQSGVTVGGAAASLIVPLVAVALHWQGGVIAIALLGLLSFFILQTLHAEFDSDRVDTKLDWSFLFLIKPVRQIMKIPLLRGFALVGFTYAGVQISVSSFFVVYLVEQGFSLVDAGLCFLFVNFGGIIGRVVWGSLSDKWLTPKYTLTVIGLVSAISLCCMYLISGSWNTFLLFIFSFVLGASTHGWNGVFLAEVADQAPPGESHNWTGGVQFVIYGGVAVMPPLFGLIIVLSGGYVLPFFLIAGCALVASIALLVLYRVYTGFN